MHSLGFERHGDRINTPWFEEFLPRLLEDRDRAGLTDMVREIDAIMLTVEPGCGVPYVRELALMTPYHYLETLESDNHWTHLLRVGAEAPDLLVREVRDPGIRDIFRSLNEVYPIGARRPNSRYMGEVLRVTDLRGVVELQKPRGVRFFGEEQVSRLDLPGNMAIVKPSPYTHNIVAYRERRPEEEREYALGRRVIHADARRGYLEAKETQARLGLDQLILPIDHLATRVYSQNREAAILEYLTLSSYYYWGSYDIAGQNSTTNVTRSVHHADERVSPAKVFTAARQPYFVDHLVGLPSPTENFVRNYGPRLHHIALAVADGETRGQLNIDYVVDAIRAQGKDFLLDVVGSREEGLKQIFSSASEHSALIIEYVQRFGDFEGFFARRNVAELTRAAGLEEGLRQLQAEGAATA